MRWFLSLVILLLLALPVLAEDSFPDIRMAASSEEALAALIFPTDGALPDVQPGRIRYVSQNAILDENYRKAFWLGGEEGSELDLTLKENAQGREYEFHMGVMCTRAAYSMALSYLGIDMSPGAMSALTERRHMNPPYKAVSALAGVTLVSPKGHVFDTMMDNYLSDFRYSPVYLYFEKPSGVEHAVLVVAALEETGQYLVVDPTGMRKGGELHRVYMIALDKMRHKIVHSTFREELAGSRLLQLYQWQLTDSPAP